jgi:hypothetical protein
VNGVEIDEINTVFEFVDEVVLGHTDTTPEDEDDDEPDFFQITKVAEYHYSQDYFEFKPTWVKLIEHIHNTSHHSGKLNPGNTEILVPPPEA